MSPAPCSPQQPGCPHSHSRPRSPSRGQGLLCRPGVLGTGSSRGGWASTRRVSQWAAGTFVFPALSPEPIQPINKCAVRRVCSALIREAVGAGACVCMGERFYICRLEVKHNATVW